MSNSIRPYRCPNCHSTELVNRDVETIACKCGSTYSVRYGIIDFIPEPSQAVKHELTGLAHENNVSVEDGCESVKLLRTARIETLDDLMTTSRHEPGQYYQQTMASYLEGLSMAQIDSGMKVLEIGSERRFANLTIIRDFCAEAYAVNIFFHISDENEDLAWPSRVLGDMNDLPFADGYFDLIVCSATLHHTATLPLAVKEIARVLRAGGRAVIVNEPVEGRIKTLGKRRQHDRTNRDNHIHEDPVTIQQWRQSIKASGLRPDPFLPNWFGQQVARIDTLSEGVRFAGLAKRLSPVFRHSTTRDLASVVGRLPGQSLLGLPLNVVLWKDEAGRTERVVPSLIGTS